MNNGFWGCLARSAICVIGVMAFFLAIVCIGYVMTWAVSLITGETFLAGIVGLLTALICAALIAGVICMED